MEIDVAVFQGLKGSNIEKNHLEPSLLRAQQILRSTSSRAAVSAPGSRPEPRIKELGNLNHKCLSDI